MNYGITGNEQKNELWPVVARLTERLREEQITFHVSEKIGRGLRARSQWDEAVHREHTAADLRSECDLVISFGGDGSMLRTAHQMGEREIPILGVNLGHLGFLADVEVDQLFPVIEQLEAGNYRLEPRMVLRADLHTQEEEPPRWALNDFVFDKSGSASMIEIEVEVDGRPLNTYRADGLIMATPTGSTAYSLSAGGPIIQPGSGVITVTPIAPHTLTVRPVVLPENVQLTARVTTRGQPYVFAADGRSEIFEDGTMEVVVQRARHRVQLVKLPESDYFETLRSKLSWGRG